VEHTRNCRRDLAEIYRLKGFIDAINAERERCQRAFEILLALNPVYTLPADVPPKIRRCFEDAAAVPPDRRRLDLGHAPPVEVPPNAPVALAVRVEDPLRLVDQVQVWFRRAGVEVYTTVSARADDDVSVVIPALSLPPTETGYRIEYFVRAVDRWEGTLAESGSPRQPLTFAVTPGSTGTSVVTEWWFWTALGAAAAGAAALAFMATSGDPDRIDLVLEDGGVRP
jgi:hypothetical protein